MKPLRSLGLGIGWRPETAGLALSRPDVGFVEVITESLDTRLDLPTGLTLLQESGITVIPHGVALGLGGGERPDPARLARKAALAERLGAPVVSEHVAFVRAGGLNAGHLMPVPRTRAALDVLAENVRIAQDQLPVPLALEPVATLLEWGEAEMDEADFLHELVERTGCRLLLDLANLHTNSRNHGYDSIEMLDRLPLEAIAYVHVAGGVESDGLWHDTHAHALWPEVADLVVELASRVPVPGMLLERDDDYPPMAELSAELDTIAACWADGDAARSARGSQWHHVKTPIGTQTSPDVHRGPEASMVISGGGSRDGATLGEEPRAALERAQHDLLATLVADGSVPAGFVEHRVAVTRESLRHKRLHETRDAAPALAVCLGAQFGQLFQEWADEVPPLGGPRTDALAFARHLPRQMLNRAASLELLAGELRGSGRPGLRRLRFGSDGNAAMAARLPGGRIVVRG